MKANILTIKPILLPALYALLFALPSCINIKSNHPDFTYYRLTQMPISETEAASLSVDKNIYIRPFRVNNNLETSKIVVSEDNWTVRKFNYHQWTSPLNDLLTEFTINRISKYGIFRKGVSASAFSTLNDCILECNVLNCTINNSVRTDRPNNVEVSISATLLLPDEATLTYVPVFSKTYTKSLARKNNSLETAVDALSILISQINDAILVDIFPYLNK